MGLWFWTYWIILGLRAKNENALLWTFFVTFAWHHFSNFYNSEQRIFPDSVFGLKVQQNIELVFVQKILRQLSALWFFLIRQFENQVIFKFLQYFHFENNFRLPDSSTVKLPVACWKTNESVCCWFCTWCVCLGERMSNKELLPEFLLNVIFTPKVHQSFIACTNVWCLLWNVFISPKLSKILRYCWRKKFLKKCGLFNVFLTKTILELDFSTYLVNSFSP